MCGILGLIFPDKSLERITFEVFLNHRGPDDKGALFWDGKKPPTISRKFILPHAFQVAFFHHRLSILDLSEAGHQPMGTEDGRYWIVYNGEVYNYRELKEELEKSGICFRSKTDTEVVLYAYVAWGPEALNRFTGMFAFAILDILKREIFIARDFFGIKPLYYTFYRNGLAFASEIKALLSLPGFKARANPQGLYDYLRYGITDHYSETLFKDIFQLLPAHYIKIPLKQPLRPEIKRYWSPEPETTYTERDLSFKEAARRVRELFLESVELHLRSDVPVGTALSGGIDSSSIVCTIRYLNPQAEIHTFSFIAEEDPRINEERWVDIVGRHVRASVHKVKPRPQDLVRDLDELIYAQDEPFGSTSIYAQYRVFRLAKEHGIKVMLDGQGADEIFAGYSAYYVARLLSLLRQGQLIKFFQFWKRIKNIPAAQGNFYLFTRLMAYLLPESLQYLPRKILREDIFPGWMNSSWFEKAGVKSRSIWQSKNECVLREKLLKDLQKDSLPHLLRYEDRNSMWHSIESRVPFLTPKLVKFVFSLPEEYILSSDGITKAVFREAMQEIVPNAVLDRHDKIGFAPPEKQWLSTLSFWLEKILNSEVAYSIPALNIEEVRRLWRDMIEGNRPFKWIIWRVVNLICWTELFGLEYGE